MERETAMKILKELHDKSLFAERTALETLIPELTESEDEKIRKALVDALNKNLGNGIEKYGTTLNAALTWLEKQGSQQPTIIWHSVSEEPEEMKELFCEWESDDATWHDVAFYDEESKTFRHAKMPINVTKWVYVDELLEKQGISAKLSEEEQNSFSKGVLSNCALSFINYLDTHSYEGKMCVSNGECEDIDYAFHNAMWDKLHRYYCKYIEKQGEQKPAVIDFKAKNWYVSKVDGQIHDMTYNPADMVESKVGEKIEDEIEIPFGAKDSELQEETYFIPDGFHAEIDDDKVVIKKGEKPTEWSDEDERNLNGIIDEIIANRNEGPIYDIKTYNRFFGWLKSLKYRAAWKPSKEQMEALDDALNEQGFDYNYLNSLYEQLKKL